MSIKEVGSSDTEMNHYALCLIVKPITFIIVTFVIIVMSRFPSSPVNLASIYVGWII